MRLRFYLIILFELLPIGGSFFLCREGGRKGRNGGRLGMKPGGFIINIGIATPAVLNDSWGGTIC